jgi:hypothetical protein
VVELDGTHGDGGGKKVVNQVLQLGKEEREKQNPMEIKAKVLIGILFCQSRRKPTVIVTLLQLFDCEQLVLWPTELEVRARSVVYAVEGWW